MNRSVIRIIGTLMVLAAFSLFTAGLASANPYEKHKGTTIVVSWPALSHFKKAEALVDEFTKETGIEVEIDALQYLKLRDRQILEMSKKKGEYDVVSWVVMWKGEYVSKGLLSPLSTFFMDPTLADPMYDIDDVADAYLQNGGVVGGKGGPDGAGHPKSLHEGLAAVVAGADCDAHLIDEGAEVVVVNAVEVERQGCSAIVRPVEADPVDG